MNADSSELFRRWRFEHDEMAREELVRKHIALARKLARRYAATREPFDDLFQVASLGLVKAIDRFDPCVGVAFTSFAVPTIVGELKRHFRDTVWSVHLPRGLHELVLKVQNAQIKLGSASGRSPTVLEIAQYLELPTEDVVEALEAMGVRQVASLDAPIAGDGEDGVGTQHDLIGFEDEQYSLFEVSETLASAIRRLPKADRNVLELRFEKELTQKEIADRIGVSQMQVSRILRRAGVQLRDALSPSA